MNKTFKILCIDGGGIKGLYSATILKNIETQIIKDTGNKDIRIVDYFDLICGTSTGGLIALALSIGVSTDDICKFYTDHGPKIFRWSKVFPLLKQALFYGKYSDGKLRNALKEVLEDYKIGDSKCLLCIPTFDITHGTYEIFKFDHREGNLSRDNKLSMIDVALATSAAPTYFPAAEISLHDNRQYIDGGVWANNPSLVGYTEANRYFVDGKRYSNIQLLSIASMDISEKMKPYARRRRSFVGWKSRLFTTSLTGQSEFADTLLKTLSKSTSNLDYYRIDGKLSDPTHAKLIHLDKADKKALTLLKQYGNDKYHLIKNDIRRFFDSKKTYRTSDTV